jgi:hypothetical protein
VSKISGPNSTVFVQEDLTLLKEGREAVKGKGYCFNVDGKESRGSP